MQRAEFGIAVDDGDTELRGSCLRMVALIKDEAVIPRVHRPEAG